MTTRYVEKAVAGLATYFASNLQTYLTAVETAVGITAGSLVMPTILQFDSDGDNRSPLLCVFETDFAPDRDGGQRNGIWDVFCTARIEYSSDADAEAAAIKMRRYLDALIRTVLSDTDLGSAVIQVLIRGAEPKLVRGPKSTTRHTYALELLVTVAS